MLKNRDGVGKRDARQAHAKIEARIKDMKLRMDPEVFGDIEKKYE